MASDMDPRTVGARLSELRALYVPETVDEAAARLRRERPCSTESFESRVARHLGELRALCELAQHLKDLPLPRDP